MKYKSRAAGKRMRSLDSYTVKRRIETGNNIRWSLGCVNSRPVAGGSQVAEFTQPRAHLIAHLCI